MIPAGPGKSPSTRLSDKGTVNRDAAGAAEAAILSVPYSAHRDTIEQMGDVLAGKLVIDATVPINPAKPTELRTDSGRSASEETHEILGGHASVFAAFQTVSFHTLRQDEVGTDILVAGDVARKDEAMALIRSLGGNPVYAGPLASAPASGTDDPAAYRRQQAI